jgi:hypothetical protein
MSETQRIDDGSTDETDSADETGHTPDFEAAQEHLVAAEAHLAEAVEEATGHSMPMDAFMDTSGQDTAAFEAAIKTVREARQDTACKAVVHRRRGIEAKDDGTVRFDVE